MDNAQIPKADSKFQKIARKNHRRWKLRLLSKGNQRADSGGGPYAKKPDYNRAKSAPPGFGGSLEESEQLDEVIRKRDGKYCLFSKKTKRNLGCYSTRAGAIKREKQVQYFKHLKETIIREEVKNVLIEEGLWDDIKSKGKEVFDKILKFFNVDKDETTKDGSKEARDSIKKLPPEVEKHMKELGYDPDSTTQKTVLIIGDSHVDFSPFGKKLERKLKENNWVVIRAGVGATAARSWIKGSACGGGKCVKIDELPKGVDLLLICLGTNDGANAVAGKHNQTSYAQRVAGQIATIARNFGAKRTIWILPPWQRRTKSYYTQDAMEYIYKAASSSGVELFDSRPSTKDIVMNGDGDGIHVGPAGGEAWSSAVIQKVR